MIIEILFIAKKIEDIINNLIIYLGKESKDQVLERLDYIENKLEELIKKLERSQF